MSITTRYINIAGVCALLFSGLSYAQDSKNFSWHGYVAQGITQSIDSNFITSDNAITAELTEIGVNGHYQLSNTLSVAGQINYLDGGNRFERGTRIDYLFVDWTIPDLAGWQAQIHLGRFKNRHWLYSVTRDVPQTRDVAVLPQSVYFDGFRDVALGSNGIQTSFKHYGDDDIWEINWSYGRSNINDSQRAFLLGDDAQGDIKQDFVHQASVFWQPASMQWKAGLSWLDSDFTYTPAQVDTRFQGGANVRRLMLSLQYFSEYWELSSEVLREEQRNKGLFTPTFKDARVGLGGFVQFRYLFNNKISGLISYDTYVYDKDDRNGTQLERESNGAIPAYFGYMDSVAIGGRWDIAPTLRLQAEHHWVEGGTRAVSLLNPDIQSHTEKYWQMWSLQLMYWF